MSMKIVFLLRLFCCILILVSSAKSKENEENSGEENKNEFEKINQVLTELKATIAINKLHGDKADVIHDQQFQQLLMSQNKSKEREDELKDEINHINQILNGLTKKNIQTCNRSHEEFYELEKPDYTWVITDMNRKWNHESFVMLSDVFPLRGYPFGAQAKIIIFHEYLHIQLSFKGGNESDEALPLEIFPTVAFTFKNHSENYYGPDTVIQQQFQQFNASFQFDTFSEAFRFIALERNYHLPFDWMTTYKLNDTVSIDIHVEPPEWSQLACSYNGTLTWAIKDYRMKLKKERDMRLFRQVSPYFYTSPKGYRMLIVFLLECEDETRREGLSAFTQIIQGPNDEALDESYSFRFTLTFFHPNDPNKHITKSVDKRRGLYMGTHEEIEHLLVNDTLNYNFTVVEIQ